MRFGIVDLRVQVVPAWKLMGLAWGWLLFLYVTVEGPSQYRCLHVTFRQLYTVFNVDAI